MKINEQEFFNFNWAEFVHIEFLKRLLALVPNFDLSALDNIKTVDKLTITKEPDTQESVLTIEYTDQNGQAQTYKIVPEITKRVNEIISERIKINNAYNEAQDWQTITFDWNDVDEGEQETIKPLEISFTSADDSRKFAIPQIRIWKTDEKGTNIPRFIDFDKEVISVYSTRDENNEGNSIKYDFSLYLTKEEATQVYATIEALNAFKDEVANTYATQSSLTELSTMLQNMITENVNNLTSEQDTIKQNVNSLGTDVSTLKTDMTDVKDKLDNINTSSSTYDSNITILPFDVTGFYYDVSTKTAYSVTLTYDKAKTGLVTATQVSADTDENGDHYTFSIPQNVLITDLSYTKGEVITDHDTPFDALSGLYLKMRVYTQDLDALGSEKYYYSTVAKFHNALIENPTSNTRFNATAYANPGTLGKDQTILIMIPEGSVGNDDAEKIQVKIDNLVTFIV